MVLPPGSHTHIQQSLAPYTSTVSEHAASRASPEYPSSTARTSGRDQPSPVSAAKQEATRVSGEASESWFLEPVPLFQPLQNLPLLEPLEGNDTDQHNLFQPAPVMETITGFLQLEMAGVAGVLLAATAAVFQFSTAFLTARERPSVCRHDSSVLGVHFPGLSW